MRQIHFTIITVLIAACVACAAVTSTKTPDPSYGPMTKTVVTAVPTPGDTNEIGILDKEIWGDLLRITIAATGTEHDFSVIVSDGNSISLFSKTDCNTTLLPLSYAFYFDDTEGNPHYGVPVAGALTVGVYDVNYAAEIQTLTPDANATSGPFTLSYDGQTTTAIDEVVTISDANDPCSGTFTLSFGGQTTSALQWDSTAEEIDTALEALSTIGENEVICSGGPLPDDITITFDNALGGQNVGAITFTDVDLVPTGTAVYEITVTTAGSGLVYGSSIATIQTAIDALSNVESGDITVSGATLAGLNEKVTIAEVNDPCGGTFKLTFDSQQTDAVDYDVNAAELTAALEALTSIGDANVICTGGPLPNTPIVIEFTGTLASMNVGAITFQDVDLTPTDGNETASFSLTVTQTGAPAGLTFTFAASLGDVPMISIDDDWLTGPTSCPVVESVAGGSNIGAVTITLIGKEERH